MYRLKDRYDVQIGDVPGTINIRMAQTQSGKASQGWKVLSEPELDSFLVKNKAANNIADIYDISFVKVGYTEDSFGDINNYHSGVVLTHKLTKMQYIIDAADLSRFLNGKELDASNRELGDVIRNNSTESETKGPIGPTPSGDTSISKPVDTGDKTLVEAIAESQKNKLELETYKSHLNDTQSRLEETMTKQQELESKTTELTSNTTQLKSELTQAKEDNHKLKYDLKKAKEDLELAEKKAGFNRIIGEKKSNVFTPVPNEPEYITIDKLLGQATRQLTPLLNADSTKDPMVRPALKQSFATLIKAAAYIKTNESAYSMRTIAGTIAHLAKQQITRIAHVTQESNINASTYQSVMDLYAECDKLFSDFKDAAGYYDKTKQAGDGNRDLTGEDLAIVADYKQGIYIKDLTHKYSLSSGLLYKVLDEHNVERRGKSHVLDAKTVSAIIKKRAEGVSLDELAEDYGVPAEKIKSLLAAKGL